MSKKYERERATLQEKAKTAEPVITSTDFIAEVLKATSKTGVSVHSIQMGCGAGQSLKHIIKQKSFSVSQHNALLLLGALGFRLVKVKVIKRSKKIRK